MERYLSIKIKALKKDDTHTTIDDVADEAFWKEGFVEFLFPASGYYAPAIDQPTSENISNRGVNGTCWSSSLWVKDSDSRYLNFNLINAHVGHNTVGDRFPLRLVRVQK